jgi:hypothetical protein
MSYLRTSQRRREREQARQRERRALGEELERFRASGRLVEVVIPWKTVGVDPRDAADAFDFDAASTAAE